jgi:hypothetical protein
MGGVRHKNQARLHILQHEGRIDLVNAGRRHGRVKSKGIKNSCLDSSPSKPNTTKSRGAFDPITQPPVLTCRGGGPGSHQLEDLIRLNSYS